MRPCPVQLAPGPSHQPSRRDDDCSPHGRSLLAIHTPQRIRHIFQPRGRVHHRGRGCGRRRFAVPKTLCFTCFSMDIKLDSLRQRAVTSGSARQTLHINNQTKRPPPRFGMSGSWSASSAAAPCVAADSEADRAPCASCACCSWYSTSSE